MAKIGRRGAELALSAVLTLRDHRVSLADALQRLQLYLPLLEHVVGPVGPVPPHVPVEQPEMITETTETTETEAGGV